MMKARHSFFSLFLLPIIAKEITHNDPFVLIIYTVFVLKERLRIFLDVLINLLKKQRRNKLDLLF